MKAIEALLHRARKRWLWNLAIEQLALAAAVALGGVILLLVLGTQILAWYWLAALFCGALGFGLYRILRRVPSHYAIAQTLDRRLQSHDVLSTAWFYGQPECNRPADKEVAAIQREEAARLAGSVDVRHTIPFTMPRAVYAVTLLAIAAGSMMGLRYGLRRSLDLRAPIAQVVFDFFHPFTRETKYRTPEEKRLRDLLKDSGIPLNEQTGQIRAGDPQDSALTSDAQEGKASDPDFKRSSTKSGGENNEPESSDEPSEGASVGPEKSASDSAENGQPGKPQDQQKKGKQGPRNEEESSLMQKMREAMANLLDKLKIQPPKDAGGQQTEQASNKGLPSGQSQKGQDPNGKPMPGKPQSGGQEAKADSEQTGEGAEKAEGGKNSKGERGADERAAEDGKSGIGRDDGDKQLRDAENQAAMGKISELLGKRAQNITGEMMVEVSSGKQQQLKTQYSTQRSSHAESGGEIHRDEVPLIYQQYVQQYFEEIRKTPAKGKQAIGANQ